ncbi:linker histone H1 and H5 family-domain-containing protein [Blyttiomyces helicus]|uniref:Histone H1 n=1 Tax=Blyttiomyces helicus TaxID=388810 RepID=A0A4P9W3H2_9FUNG|nr:linker histone H1 and H5 family-domain-containing protein [Blyttiomyces helicus]|eukprot:RKO85803.1 linker histone H1 and H5 family-domain-containing protein [Blyttiomyces helicus]
MATPTSPKKAAAKTATHPAYKEMIVKAIASLAEKNGSSRQAIKKYIFANFKVAPSASADAHFKLALKRGVDASDFVMPKGALGTIKLAPEFKKAAAAAEKKAAAPPAVKKVKKVVAKPAVAKKVTPNKVTNVAAKKAVVKKVAKAKPATVKKTAAPKNAAAAKKSSPKKAAPKKAAVPAAAPAPKAKRGPPKARA